MFDEKQYAKQYYHNNRDRLLQKAKVNQLKRKYGLTAEQWHEMHDKQKGCCAICKEVFEFRVHVDHCHDTGKVRSLLCFNCNGGLGNFKDNSNLLTAAIKYLEEHSV